MCDMYQIIQPANSILKMHTCCACRHCCGRCLCEPLGMQRGGGPILPGSSTAVWPGHGERHALTTCLAYCMLVPVSMHFVVQNAECNQAHAAIHPNARKTRLHSDSFADVSYIAAPEPGYACTVPGDRACAPDTSLASAWPLAPPVAPYRCTSSLAWWRWQALPTLPSRCQRLRARHWSRLSRSSREPRCCESTNIMTLFRSTG